MEIKRRDFLHQLGVGSVGALLANSSMSSSTAEAQEATKAPHTTGVDYQPSEVEVAGNNLFVRRYGKGPAILMIHGFPRTSLMWRDLAPKFAEDHTVICVDLRAYGQSGTPPSSDDHAPYSKRVMAAELVGLMDQLGFQTFTVVGHDRGGRVAYRMALDHPEKVERLAVFDVIPISEAWNRADGRFAKTYWPFSLLAQKAPLPEKYLLGAPEAVFGNPFGDGSFGPEILEQYVSTYRDPVAGARHLRRVPCRRWHRRARGPGGPGRQEVDPLSDAAPVGGRRTVGHPLRRRRRLAGHLAGLGSRRGRARDEGRPLLPGRESRGYLHGSPRVPQGLARF